MERCERRPGGNNRVAPPPKIFFAFTITPGPRRSPIRVQAAPRRFGGVGRGLNRSRAVNRGLPREVPEPDQFFAERVLAVVHSVARPRDCRDVRELATGSSRLAPREAHQLLVEQPGALYLEVDGARIALVPARAGAVLYVRALAKDSPDDPLLDLPEAADR